MKRNLTTLLALSLGAAIASPVFAQSAIVLGERPITRAEVTSFVKKQFATMDTDHNGSISPAEFETYHAQQGGKAEAGLGHIGGHWFEKADENGDGRVTIEEAEARPLQLFDLADINHDGTASVEEQSMAQLFMGK
jgi:Ca2+-binding EF-hand superfamily protein